ncbi:hypothetical protein [Pseudomonas sp. 4810-S13]|jgi:hypothetical protein|uniref:hypothetical protein n=1 Tax=Pseudomonas sp. 4810-S13 TaxID=3120822 RepID=UPI0031B66EBB
MTSKTDTVKEQSNTWTQGGQAKSLDAATAMSKFLAVTTDTADLAQAPKSTADAILANVKTSVLLKAGQPVPKDEFREAVSESEVHQFNRERTEQHEEQELYKASSLAAAGSPTKNAD